MKAKILTLSLLGLLTSCRGEDKDCRCYSQLFKREYVSHQYGSPVYKTDILNDTGYISDGVRKEYSNNCKDNGKVFGHSFGGIGITTEYDKTINRTAIKHTDKETRVECH